MFARLILSICILFFSEVVYSKNTINIPIHEVQSKDKITAWIVENHALPIVSVGIVFKRAGYTYDLPGIAYMATQLLSQSKENGLTLQEKCKALGAEVYFSVSKDNFFINIKTLSKHLNAVMKLLSNTLVKANFTPQDIVHGKQVQSIAIARAKENPYAVALKSFTQTVFTQHIYAQTLYGNKETLAKITRQDIAHYFAKAFRKQNILIAFAGDIQDEQVYKILDDHMSKLPNTTSIQTKTQYMSIDIHGIQKTVPMNIAQTIILFIKNGIKRSSSDYYPAYLLNKALGQGLESILSKEIRIKHALTYNINTDLIDNDYVSLLLGIVATSPSNSNKTIAKIKHVFNEVAYKGLTKTLLRDVQNNEVNAFMFSLDNNSSIVSHLLYMQRYGLSKDYLNKYTSYIQSVELTQVNKVAKQLLNANDLLFIKVGKEQL